MNFETKYKRAFKAKAFLRDKVSIYEIYQRHGNLDFVFTKDDWKNAIAKVVSIKNITKDEEGNEIVGDPIEIGEPLKRKGFYYAKYEVMIVYITGGVDPETGEYGVGIGEPYRCHSPHLERWQDLTAVQDSEYWDEDEQAA